MVPPYFAAHRAAFPRCNVRKRQGYGAAIHPAPSQATFRETLMRTASQPTGRSLLGGVCAYSSCSSGKTTRPPVTPSSPDGWEENSSVFLLFGHVDDLHAVVVTAMLAHAVGKLLFVALRAFDDAGQAQLPIGTAAADTFPLGRAIVTPPHPS